MKTIKQLQILYFLIWIIPVLLTILYMMGLLGKRTIWFNGQQEFALIFVSIILTMADIYYSSKLFRFKIVIRTMKRNPENSLQTYIYWNILRYVTTILTILLCLFTYMTTTAGDMKYAALILVIASAFWFPSRQEQKFIANN